MKNTKKYFGWFLLLVSSFFCSTFLFAQIQNEKGDLIMKNGEVISGDISYYYDQPTDIIFHDEKGAKNIFTPTQINEIQLNSGERFVSKTYQDKQDSQVLILQLIIESPIISLFKREENSQMYYYVSKNNSLYRLENNDVLIVKEGKNYTRQDYQYIGILGALMPDRPDLVKELRKIFLNEKDLSNLILDYNRGNVSYYWSSYVKEKRNPNWVFFGQFSNYVSYYVKPTTEASWGVIMGFQYYFSSVSRHSLKYSIDYSTYHFESSRDETISLGLRYEFDFWKSKKSSAFFMVHIADISYISSIKTRYILNNRTTETTNTIGFRPRLSPGIGFEVKPWSRIAIYAEVNRLMQLTYIPYNFSIGLKYDFGNKNW